MPSVCFYFQVHQPRRIKRYRVFDIGRDKSYFNDSGEGNLNNKRIVDKVARKCYLPANATMLELLKRYPEFKISYSLSGVFLDQLEEYAPEVLRTFQDLVATGQVEILSETYFHSLASLYSHEEFRAQVELHRDIVKRLFHVTPTTFRNTELIFNNDIAEQVSAMGYTAMLTEGADHLLGWRSPNFVYRSSAAPLKLLLKNYKLSDDIAFRFSSRDWSEWPLTAPKFSQWVNAVNGNGVTVNLFMDYETFGEHQWEDTGIFEFLKALPHEILKHPDNNFATPTEVAQRHDPVAELDVPHAISWADVERDLSAWLSNDMQNEASRAIYSLEHAVKALGDDEILRDWRRLLTSDHFYYMCTKWWNDGDVHKYFSPYNSPYEAFIYFMNTVHDMRARVGYTVDSYK